VGSTRRQGRHWQHDRAILTSLIGAMSTREQLEYYIGTCDACVCTRVCVRLPQVHMGPGDTAYSARWSGRLPGPGSPRHTRTRAQSIYAYMHACAKKQHIYKALYTSPLTPPRAQICADKLAAGKTKADGSNERARCTSATSSHRNNNAAAT